MLQYWLDIAKALSIELSILVKPTGYVDPDGALNHLHKIPYHLSVLKSSSSGVIGLQSFFLI